MDPPELTSEPPRSRFGAALNSVPHLTPLGRLMLGHVYGQGCFHIQNHMRRASYLNNL